ncbi:FAM21A family protein [Megaselia abdita]
MEWTTNRVLQESKDWSLNGDCGILKIMENFEKNLESQAVKTTKTLKDVSKTVEKASISLNNTTNKLANLQHSQFIENLVREDEVPQQSTSAEKKKNEEKPDPIQILDKILGNNVKMLNNYYEKISINLDDSDDEDETPNAIYRPRNVFNERALPYIFGSKEWTEHWHVGLCDSDDDFSEDEIEEFSDDEDIPAPTPSESELGSIWNLNQPQAASSEASSSTKGSLSTIPHEVNRESIPDERFYVHKPKVKANRLFEESDEEVESVSTHGEKEHSLPKGDLFNEEYNSFMKELEKRVEERVDPSSINASVIVEQKKTTIPKVVKKKETARKEPSQNKVKEAPVLTPQQPITRTKLSNLFDDEPPDDDFDNLFGDSNNFIKTKLGTQKRSVNLFDDDVEEEEDNDIFVNSNTKHVGKVFLDDDPPEDLFPSTIEKQQDINENSYEGKNSSLESDLSKNVEKKEISKISEQSSKSVFNKYSEVASKKTPVGLFDDPPEDDDYSIFNVAHKKSSISKVNNSNDPVHDNSSLNIKKDDIKVSQESREKHEPFKKTETSHKNEESEPTQKLIESKVKPEKNETQKKLHKTPLALFDDPPEDDENSVFAHNNTNGKVQDNSSPNTSKDKINVKHKFPEKDELFKKIDTIGENEEPEIIPKLNESTEVKHKKKTPLALFDDPPEDDENSLFNISPKKQLFSEVNKKKSLFDDVDLEDDDDFFSSIKSDSKTKEKQKEKPRSKSLFPDEHLDDDDFLISDVVPKSQKDDSEALVLSRENEDMSKPPTDKTEENVSTVCKVDSVNLSSPPSEKSSNTVEISTSNIKSQNEGLKTEDDEIKEEGEFISKVIEGTGEELEKFEDDQKPLYSVGEEKLENQNSLEIEDDLNSKEETETEDWFQPTNEPIVAVQPPLFTKTSYFSDEPPEDTTDNIQRPKPLPVSIFNDEPPDDEDFFATFPIPKKPATKTITLFSDEPPEDDNFFSSIQNEEEKPPLPTETISSQKKVFYDDIDETKSTITNSSVADLIKKVTTKPEESAPKKDQPKVKKLNSSSININVSALLPGAKRAKQKIGETEETMEKNSDEEVKTNLSNKINESALLPGAKNSQFEDTLENQINEEKSSNKEHEKRIGKFDSSAVKINVSALLPGAKRAKSPVEVDVTPVSSDVGSLKPSDASKSSDGLSHITKSRSKGMPKRRPSTRKGRQEMYKKSLISNDDSKTTITPTSATSKPAVAKPVKNTSLFSSSDEESNVKPSALNNHKKKSDSKHDSKLSSIAQRKNVVKSHGLFSSDEDELFAEKTSSKSKKPLPKTSAPKNNLFDDSGNDDDDLFGEQNKKPTTSISGTVKAKLIANKSTKSLPKEAPKPVESTNADNPLADLL